MKYYLKTENNYLKKQPKKNKNFPFQEPNNGYFSVTTNYLLDPRWRKVQGLYIDVGLTCFRSLCGTKRELTHDLIYFTFISYSHGIATGPKFCSIRYNFCLPNK